MTQTGIGEKSTIVFYALGSGAGHIIRVAAIARKLRQDYSGRLLIITNSKYCELLHTESIPFIHIPTESLPYQETRKRIVEALHFSKPSALVTDVFPCGMGGELIAVLERARFKKILIRRILKKEYLERLSREGARLPVYDCIIDSEPDLPPLPSSIDCSPILVRDFEELPSKTEARKLLNCREDDKIILVIFTGKQAIVHSVMSLLEKLAGSVSPRNQQLRWVVTGNIEKGTFVRYYPLISLLPGVQMVIGAAGYNVFHETRALSVPTLYVPIPQKYDDQLLRARKEAVSSPEELEKRLYEMIRSMETDARPTEPYFNGASKAAFQILECLERS